MPKVIGQMLLTNNDTTGTTYYTDYEPRRGAKMFVTVQVLADAGSSNITSITVQAKTKNIQDAIGSETNLGSAQTLTLSADTSFGVGQGVDATGSDGIKEQVRLAITIKASGSATNLPAWAMVRVLEIMWSED